MNKILEEFRENPLLPKGRKARVALAGASLAILAPLGPMIYGLADAFSASHSRATENTAQMADAVQRENQDIGMVGGSAVLLFVAETVVFIAYKRESKQIKN